MNYRPSALDMSNNPLSSGGTAVPAGPSLTRLLVDHEVRWPVSSGAPEGAVDSWSAVARMARRDEVPCPKCRGAGTGTERWRSKTRPRYPSIHANGPAFQPVPCELLKELADRDDDMSKTPRRIEARSWTRTEEQVR